MLDEDLQHCLSASTFFVQCLRLVLELPLIPLTHIHKDIQMRKIQPLSMGEPSLPRILWVPVTSQQWHHFSHSTLQGDSWRGSFSFPSMPTYGDCQFSILLTINCQARKQHVPFLARLFEEQRAIAIPPAWAWTSASAWASVWAWKC